jgi:4-hydroxy-tetrahydrodipicolinate synthase
MREAITKPFAYLSGDDPLGAAYLANGGDGIISVTANVAPRECAALYNAWTSGDIKTFLALNDKLMPLHKAMVMETNPCPVKFALSVLGLCQNELRLPLMPVLAATEEHITKIMNTLGLIDHGSHTTA